MTVKLIIYILAVFVFAVASIYASVRSRMRVRALMEEDVAAPKPCTIARSGVERFLDETRVLRQLLAGLIEETTDGIRGELDDDARAELDLGSNSRALAGWIRAYERDLDDEDRDALAMRGISAASVSSLREPDSEVPTRGLHLPEMRRHAIELERLEVAMTEAPRLAAYR